MSAEAEETNEPTPQALVQQHLEAAVKTASENGVTTSDLLGMFYYYTHSIAESYRAEALRAAQGE